MRGVTMKYRQISKLVVVTLALSGLQGCYSHTTYPETNTGADHRQDSVTVGAERSLQTTPGANVRVRETAKPLCRDVERGTVVHTSVTEGSQNGWPLFLAVPLFLGGAPLLAVGVADGNNDSTMIDVGAALLGAGALLAISYWIMPSTTTSTHVDSETPTAEWTSDEHPCPGAQPVPVAGDVLEVRLSTPMTSPFSFKVTTDAKGNALLGETHSLQALAGYCGTAEGAITSSAQARSGPDSPGDEAREIVPAQPLTFQLTPPSTTVPLRSAVQPALHHLAAGCSQQLFQQCIEQPTPELRAKTRGGCEDKCSAAAQVTACMSGLRACLASAGASDADKEACTNLHRRCLQDQGVQESSFEGCVSRCQTEALEGACKR